MTVAVSGFAGVAQAAITRTAVHARVIATCMSLGTCEGRVQKVALGTSVQVLPLVKSEQAVCVCADGELYSESCATAALAAVMEWR